MRSFSLLWLELFAVLVIAASFPMAQDASSGVIPTVGYVSCMTSTCENTTASAVNTADCTVFNLTGLLGQCTQPFGTSPEAPNVRIYCQQSTGLAYTASFGQDATCNSSSLRQVVVQQFGLCAQSNWVSCGSEDVPPPLYVSAPNAYVAEINSDQADCSGQSNTISYLLTEACSSNFNGRNSIYHACNQDGTAFIESRYTNITDYTCAQAAQQALLTRNVSEGCVSQSEASFLGAFHRWSCGNTDVSSLGSSASSMSTPVPTVGFVSCNTPTCVNTSAGAINSLDCIVTDLIDTLGQCTQPYGPGSGYAAVFCQQSSGLAYSATFGSDPTCALSNLEQVVVSHFGGCAQSNWVSCGSVDRPPPATLLDPSRVAYVGQINSDQADCGGASATTTYLLTEHCGTNFSGRNSIYHACNRNGTAFIESRYTNTTDFTCAQAAQVALLTRNVSEGCLPQFKETHVFGSYSSWICGDTGLALLRGTATNPITTPPPTSTGGTGSASAGAGGTNTDGSTGAAGGTNTDGSTGSDSGSGTTGTTSTASSDPGAGTTTTGAVVGGGGGGGGGGEPLPDTTGSAPELRALFSTLLMLTALPALVSWV